MKVGEVCNREVIVPDHKDAMLEAVQLMRSRGVRRVPLVTRSGTLTGVLAIDDLLDQIAEQLGDLVRLIGNERQKARQKRG